MKNNEYIQLEPLKIKEIKKKPAKIEVDDRMLLYLLAPLILTCLFTLYFSFQPEIKEMARGVVEMSGPIDCGKYPGLNSSNLGDPQYYDLVPLSCISYELNSYDLKGGKNQ